MRPRVSLLLIALYTTKIFCALSLINGSRPFQKKIISKQSTIKIPMRSHYPPINNSENNNTFVRTNNLPKKPIPPYVVNELFMLVI